MRRALMTILIVPLAVLAGCGEDPQVRTYESTRPASYVWPKTESRADSHRAGGIDWVWQVPAGWVDAPELADQLIADYRFKGAGEALPGRVTVSMIPGDAGGVMANVSRWQQQLHITKVKGLGPRDQMNQKPFSRGVITIVQLTGQYQGPNVPTHLLGAIVQIGLSQDQVLQSWFIKMVGDQATIEGDRANREKFAELLDSFLSNMGGAPGPGGGAAEEERPFLARPADQLDDEQADGDAEVDAPEEATPDDDASEDTAPAEGDGP